MKSFIIILLIAATGLSSCVTEKMRSKICNNCAVKIVVKDSIYEVQCWDTVRLAPITGPVIYLQNPCDSVGKLKPVLITKTKNGVKGTVNSLDNTIVFTCETDSLKAYIQTLKEKYVLNKKNESEVKYLPCKSERTKFDGFTFWWFWITLAALVVYFLLRLIKTYFKAYLPF